MNQIGKNRKYQVKIYLDLAEAPKYQILTEWAMKKELKNQLIASLMNYHIAQEEGYVLAGYHI